MSKESCIKIIWIDIILQTDNLLILANNKEWGGFSTHGSCNPIHDSRLANLGGPTNFPREPFRHGKSFRQPQTFLPFPDAFYIAELQANSPPGLECHEYWWQRLSPVWHGILRHGRSRKLLFSKHDHPMRTCVCTASDLFLSSGKSALGSVCWRCRGPRRRWQLRRQYEEIMLIYASPEREAGREMGTAKKVAAASANTKLATRWEAGLEDILLAWLA